MHRRPDQWADLNPQAVLAGSEAQRLNVMSMMQRDLVEMGRVLEAIIEACELDDKDAAHELARQARFEVEQRAST